MFRRYRWGLYALAAALVLTISASLYRSPLEPFNRLAFAVPWLDRPTLHPADEICLQAALAQEVAGHRGICLNKRLRDVSIRTALEDTARLHFDLG